MEKIFVDASFFVALIKKDDSNHKKAKEIIDRLNSVVQLHTNFICIGEASTVISQRVGKRQANELVNAYKNGDYFDLDVNKDVIFSATNLFLAQRSKNFPFFDAIHAAAMESVGLRKILTFDRHFKKLGFEIM
ncbi:type II toxin-antitoxin system VapC family toxin [Candidatus Woesebacteria bacterium]|nr:type II toxin-antitoxin system VapC family toxin [Candidatus Woesebacteria bacterium]